MFRKQFKYLWCFRFQHIWKTRPGVSFRHLSIHSRRLPWLCRLEIHGPWDSSKNLGLVDWQCNFQFNICQWGKSRTWLRTNNDPQKYDVLICGVKQMGGRYWLIVNWCVDNDCYVTSLHLGMGAEKRANIYDWVSPAILVLWKHWLNSIFRKKNKGERGGLMRLRYEWSGNLREETKLNYFELFSATSPSELCWIVWSK